jgi:hypothetical protein
MRIDLYNLAVVYVCSERLLDCLNIPVQCIRGNLHTISHPTRNILHERCRRRSVTLPYLKRRHQFGFSVDGTVRPNVAHLRIVAYSEMPLFLADESPKLIELQVMAIQILHLGIEQHPAALSDFDT